MNTERRLSESEVTAVLQRAAAESAEQGLTVAQVHEIATDVGLAPDAVRRALIESANGALRPAAIQRSLGLPTGVAKDVVLPGVLTDDAWDVLVSTLRATFNAHGKVSQSGVVREWRNGQLRIAVEPTAAGHRLRMSTNKASAMRAPILGSAAALIYAASLAAAASTKPFLLVLAAVPIAIAGGLAVWPFFSLPKWGRARSEQFDAIAREAASLCSAPPHALLP
jgi:hypothetical protein